MAGYYPPVGFHFKIEFSGIKNENDSLFQSVSGLSVDLETEEIAEGGENRFKHKIPIRTKYPNLVLKRGMLIDSEVIEWCTDTLENFKISPKDILIKLLDEKHEPLQTWSIINAYPIKWNIGDFNAEENKLVIETLEFSYNYFNII